MDIERVYEAHADMLFRIAFAMLRNRADAEDAVSDVFAKRLAVRKEFESAEHERAWLIRVTLNRCTDLLRRRKTRPVTPLEAVASLPAAEEDRSVLEAVLRLPPDRKSAVLLYYFEGFSVSEIAKIERISPSAVKMRLLRAREALKCDLEEP